MSRMSLLEAGTVSQRALPQSWKAARREVQGPAGMQERRAGRWLPGGEGRVTAGVLLAVLLVPTTRVAAQRTGAESTGPGMPKIACAWRWVPIGGGGAVMTVAVSPHRNNVVLAGCDVGGVLRSEDFGRHWTLCNTGLVSDGDRAVADFAWDPREPDVVYMGSGACFGKPEGPYGGLWRSEDEGKTWRLVTRVARFSGLGSQRQWGRVLKIDARDGSVWAGTAWDGLLRSKDRGKTWEKLGLGGEFIVGVELSAVEPETVWVAAAPTEYSTGSVWLSRDEGKSWTQALKGEKVRGVAVDPREAARAYVVVRDRGLMVTEDYGETWRPCVRGIETYLERQWGNAVAVGSVQPERVYFAACERFGEVEQWWQWRHPGLFVSEDRGGVWAPIISGSVVDGQFSIEKYLSHVDARGWWRSAGWFGFNPMGWGLDPKDPRHLYVHDFYGVWASDDGGENWRQAMEGLASTCVGAVACNPTRADEVYFGLLDVAFFRTCDGGRSIEYFESSYPASNCTNLAVETREGEETIYSVATGRLVVSKDRGETWSRDMSQPPEGAELGPVTLDRFRPHLLYCGRWRSSDGGQSWQEMSGLGKGWAGQVVSDPSKQGRLYAWDTYGVQVSEDDGKTWTDVSTGIPAVHQGKRRITGLAVLGDGKVMVGSAVHGLLMSEDKGKTWRAVLRERYISALDCGPDGKTVVAAAWTPWYHEGYEAGVFVSLDGSKSWARIDENLGVTARVSAIAVDPLRAGRVWIGTSGNAVYVGQW